jgi:tetratricopeptide (TPR) repeat protein
MDFSGLLGGGMLTMMLAASVGVPLSIAIYKLVHFGFEAFREKERERVARETVLVGRNPAKLAQVFVRHDDVATLSKEQVQQKEHAAELVKLGKFMEAALIYRELTLERTAIQTLEDAGLILEASGMLLEKNLPNRAGFLCLRNGRFSEAAECFLSAKMYADAGKAFARAALPDYRYYRNAAEAYEAGGQIFDAINAYENILDLGKACELALKIRAYDRILSLATNSVFFVGGNVSIGTGVWQSALQEVIITPKVAQDFGWVVANVSAIQDLNQILKRFGDDSVLYRFFLAGMGLTASEKLVSAFVLLPVVVASNSSMNALADALLLVNRGLLAGCVFEKSREHVKAARAYLQGGGVEKARSALQSGGHTKAATDFDSIFDRYRDGTNAVGREKASAMFWEDINAVLASLG